MDDPPRHIPLSTPRVNIDPIDSARPFDGGAGTGRDTVVAAFGLKLGSSGLRPGPIRYIVTLCNQPIAFSNHQGIPMKRINRRQFLNNSKKTAVGVEGSVKQTAE